MDLRRFRVKHPPRVEGLWFNDERMAASGWSGQIFVDLIPLAANDSQAVQP